MTTDLDIVSLAGSDTELTMENDSEARVGPAQLELEDQVLLISSTLTQLHPETATPSSSHNSSENVDKPSAHEVKETSTETETTLDEPISPIMVQLLRRLHTFTSAVDRFKDQLPSRQLRLFMYSVMTIAFLSIFTFLLLNELFNGSSINRRHIAIAVPFVLPPILIYCLFELFLESPSVINYVLAMNKAEAVANAPGLFGHIFLHQIGAHMLDGSGPEERFTIKAGEVLLEMTMTDANNDKKTRMHVLIGHVNDQGAFVPESGS